MGEAVAAARQRDVGGSLGQRGCDFFELISLSGKRVCDSPSIRVSEISVYFENRWVVPMLGKDLFTLHFAKA